MSGKRLAGWEIALIKAMQRAGFTAQKVLSYFSHPERTINVARIYEIRDGDLGGDVPAASEAELHEFVAKFAADHPLSRDSGPLFAWKPPPAYIEVSGGRVSLQSRSVRSDDKRLELAVLESMQWL